MTLLPPCAGGHWKLWGLYKWLQAKTDGLRQAIGGRKKRCPTSSLPIDHVLTMHTHVHPYVSPSTIILSHYS